MYCVCGVCSKWVKRNQRNLLCTVCKSYIHKCCSDLTCKEFKSKENVKYWHCKKCNEEISLPFNHINGNNKFMLELYRMFENKLTNINLGEKFENVSLDPTIFQTELDENNCNSYTKYFSDEELKTLHGNTKSNMSILNANIRSLDKNLDSFKDLLYCSELNFEIIGLVETWLKDKPQDYFHLNGYGLEFNNRKNGRGGAVCLYIKNDMKYHIRHDLAQIKHPEHVESLFVEIERTGSKNVIAGVICRPPGQDVQEFNRN